MPGHRHSQRTPTWLGQERICVFRCHLPPALLAEWPGSFTCHYGNTGLEQASNKSQHTKLSLEKKILPPGFELATFRSRVRCAYQQAIPASWPVCSVELCDQSTAGSPLHAFFNGSLTNPKREGSFLNGPADDDSDMGWVKSKLR